MGRRRFYNLTKVWIEKQPMSLAPNLLQILYIPLLLPPNSLLLVWG